ncbi:sensor histidine kinase [Pedobacter sp. Hv1]|uniref:sensor histidine kinase n=1 Tax=Pedobacter sp. Hv1 TaxID=1740090 RepID=UPI0006D8D265|nr:histidine kinase [Pedobacter sp. Hv1]KQC02775.1 hypothetical protein AQF98_04155 [Pedobacter sp. Hv1]
MKNIVWLILLLSSVLVKAQKEMQTDTGKYVQIKGSGYFVVKSDSSKYLRYDGEDIFDIRKATKGQLAGLKNRERINILTDDRFWGLSIFSYQFPFPRQSLGLRFQQNTKAKIYEGRLWKWGTLYRNTILIDGQSDVEVIDGLITAENAKDYRYRIIQNDNKELVSWTTPTVFKKTANQLTTYCYLGNIPYQKNQFILIEIYNVKNYKDRDAIIIDWRPTRKMAFWTTVDYRKKGRKTNVYSVSLGNDKESARVNFIETDTLKDIRFRLGDSLVRLGFRSHHQATPYDYQINYKRTINEKVERTDLGVCDGTYFLYKEFWDQPGQYEITFTPKLSSVGGKPVLYQSEKGVTYKFTVLPELNPKKLFSKRELLLMGVVAAPILIGIVLLIIFFIRRRARKRLAKEYQQKTIAQLQLSSVRSQLNPHFMFNALAGIQSFMNQHKIDEANRYLGKFARLTRNVLDNNELVSLTEEKALLTDYLEMEQLRFGFSYELLVAANLDIENIEIPAMLLQPFVENAVKHGIAEKETAGTIIVSFAKKDQDLILTVRDNGNGFDVEKDYEGLGLQLSKNRISLLNTIYSITPLVLVIKSDTMATEVTITLTQWL